MFGYYKYDVGNVVQLVRGGKAYTVKWRGYLEVPNPHGGIGRVSVYRLDNGYWDCYYENELHSAWRWE
jgi:hypothetical protein